MLQADIQITGMAEFDNPAFDPEKGVENENDNDTSIVDDPSGIGF